MRGGGAPPRARARTAAREAVRTAICGGWRRAAGERAARRHGTGAPQASTPGPRGRRHAAVQAGPRRPLLPGGPAGRSVADLPARRLLSVHGVAAAGPGGRVRAGGPGLQHRADGGGPARADAEPRLPAAAVFPPPAGGGRARGAAGRRARAACGAAGGGPRSADPRLRFPSLRRYCWSSCPRSRGARGNSLRRPRDGGSRADNPPDERDDYGGDDFRTVQALNGGHGRSSRGGAGRCGRVSEGDGRPAVPFPEDV